MVETYDFNAVNIYKMVLNEELNLFPKYFWQKSTSLFESAEITKYLIEEVLKWDDKDIVNKLSVICIQKNKLGKMLEVLFNNNIYMAINNAYPNRFKVWELKRRPVDDEFWTDENTSLALHWLFEEKLKWSDEDIKEKLNKDTFKKNSLHRLLDVRFNGIVYDALNFIYPNKFKTWELKVASVGNGGLRWSDENIQGAIKWLIEDELKWNDEDIKTKLNAKTFNENDLYGLLSNHFKGSPFRAIDAVYPNKFKPWELKQTPCYYWNKDTIREAGEWLFNEKLKWSIDDIRNNISLEILKEYGLYDMVRRHFKRSKYLFLKEIYPNDDWSMIRSRFNTK